MEKELSLSEPEEMAELARLYDFYGSLLKENHRRIFEDYVLNNFSLGEIAREREITRQGVYDVLRRCRIRLRDYEEKLQLVRRFRSTEEKLRQIAEIAGSCGDKEAARRIGGLVDEIQDML